MATSIPIPKDVQTWLRRTFARANEAASRRLSNNPHAHETSLDFTLIEELTKITEVIHFPSDWSVRIDAHFLGGGAHFGTWEIADIGIIVLFRHRGEVKKSKIALLQSKRLYPHQLNLKTHPLFKWEGFGGLWESEQDFRDVCQPRTFEFSTYSEYRSLDIRADQFNNIQRYEEQTKIPVYYLLYNPVSIPFKQVVPMVPGGGTCTPCRVGSRIIPAKTVRASMQGTLLTAPTLGSLMKDEFRSGKNKGGWRFETFIVDLVIPCKEGYVAESPLDQNVRRVFYDRTGPIASAIAVNIAMPDGFRFEE